eukprot:CAMPEP_0169417232 /NCGR_PEP_ID=MMETSP1017-20121227/63597_1 /TAXON_ID=342587 /ORGANISM="Karlodinium micrum, Strain CCMP2283" /LENGTH=49 /DNA_ID= /DNA_START= /DNA_END= /DNA_ORIENTATION=
MTAADRKSDPSSAILPLTMHLSFRPSNSTTKPQMSTKAIKCKFLFAVLS